MFKTRISPTRASGLAAAGVLALFGAAACSSSTSAKSSAPAAQGAAPPAAAGGSSSSSSSAPSGATSTVSTSSVSVAGKATTVLVAPDGKTLYYFTPDDAAGKATCTGTCAQAWPPLKSSATPTAGAGVTGSLMAAMGPNGDQVTYNGHPLYEYMGDTKAGQANGQGVLGKWFAATPTLIVGGGAPSSSPTAPATSGGSSGGNGYNY